MEKLNKQHLYTNSSRITNHKKTFITSQTTPANNTSVHTQLRLTSDNYISPSKENNATGFDIALLPKFKSTQAIVHVGLAQRVRTQ